MEKINLGDIILIILVVISISIALWFWLGNSPTFEQIVLAFLLTAVFGVAINVTKMRTELKSLSRSFNALAKDFKVHIRK